VLLADGGDLPASAVIVATGAAAAAALLPGLRVPRTRTVTTVYHAAAASPLAEPTLLVDTEREILHTCVLSEVSPGYGNGRALISSSVLGRGRADREPAVRSRLATLYQTDTADWEHLGSYTVEGALPAMPAPLPLSQPCRVDVAGGTGPGGAGPGSTGAGRTGAGPGGASRDGTRRYVCGDHRATGSIQGALASGTRAAREVLADA
jgi:hypothetical protein